ncbi:MAG: hypothetical protein K1X83_11815 [Oligoflexia bacterium]|nr:hypothetical protein [Oligoflexia bacterium]
MGVQGKIAAGPASSAGDLSDLSFSQTPAGGPSSLDRARERVENAVIFDPDAELHPETALREKEAKAVDHSLTGAVPGYHPRRRRRGSRLSEFDFDGGEFELADEPEAIARSVDPMSSDPSVLNLEKSQQAAGQATESDTAFGRASAGGRPELEFLRPASETQGPLLPDFEDELPPRK